MAPPRARTHRTNADSTWEIQFTEEFLKQLRKAPDSIYKSLSRNGFERLKNSPCDGSEIKQLRGWKSLYRLRLDNYRVIYRPDRAQRQVSLLKIGHRKSIYEQLGHDPGRNTPCARIVADPRSHALIEWQPDQEKPVSADIEAQRAPASDSESVAPGVNERLPSRFNARFLRELGIAGGEYEALLTCQTEDDLLALVDEVVREEVIRRILDTLYPGATTSTDLKGEQPGNETSGSPQREAKLGPSSESAPPGDDPRLPSSFNAQLLQDLDIVDQDRAALLKCMTEGDLAECQVPGDVLEIVLDALWPESIVRSVDAPRRVVDSADDLHAIAEGARGWESFLLALDDTQKPFVERFTGSRPSGPWMLKGGPGSGKSTVALYCIRNLLQSDQATLYYDSEPLKILFTTYTKALTTASAQLLNALGIDPSRQEVDIINVDKLASRNARGPKIEVIYRANDETWLDVVRVVLEQVQEQQPRIKLTSDDAEFLHHEINEVIVGHSIASERAYLEFKRSGRGTALGPRQRADVWKFYLAVRRELKKRRLRLPSHVFRKAGKSARPTYDYVFIDEAQDLAPVAVRMCVEMSKAKQNVFLTADRNQSIYNAGFSWKQVAEVLDFRGRSTVLRRNYRTTREIMRAIRHLLDVDQHVDRETRDDESGQPGPRPELRYASQEGEAEVVQEWLDHTIKEQGAENMAAAVLCPTIKDCLRIADALTRAGLAAKAMKGEDFDLGFDGVKVTTMHGAKGLEFRIVAVVGLADGRMPWKKTGSPEDQDEIDKLRRTFFVACSRAMERLLVVADPRNPSPFVEGFNRTHWNVA